MFGKHLYVQTDGVNYMHVVIIYLHDVVKVEISIDPILVVFCSVTVNVILYNHWPKFPLRVDRQI